MLMSSLAGPTRDAATNARIDQQQHAANHGDNGGNAHGRSVRQCQRRARLNRENCGTDQRTSNSRSEPWTRDHVCRRGYPHILTTLSVSVVPKPLAR
jgi:hypothetical protein